MNRNKENVSILNMIMSIKDKIVNINRRGKTNKY